LAQGKSRPPPPRLRPAQVSLVEASREMAPALKAPLAATIAAPATALAAAEGRPIEEPFVYPVPLYVRNTFLEAQTGRPASLEGFYLERQVFSCPGSRISEPGSGCEGVSSGTRAGRPAPYCPGEQFLNTAAFGSSAPLAMLPVAGTGAAKVEKVEAGACAVVALDQAASQDTGSECSTADTSMRSPPSPDLEVASTGEAPQSASPPLPNMSVGSIGHDLKQCRPCAFFHTKGCASGKDCQFCHLCEPGEKTRRQKEKRAFFGAMRQIERIRKSGWSNGATFE